ncbi:hypothetical protein FNV43_RR12947 [Rhamnella rubrinervis]|uniref:Leucine-rich repeat-containing N-terminal plant-type domain-containing protein n=1 Tax=Rhamnella rubrinervis TaxID=2594499 RepID=A0A8K0H094_9ROSA|nr:hypothetical protein FNV43_RR12947 [Rhamnella rubrinervis]
MDVFASIFILSLLLVLFMNITCVASSLHHELCHNDERIALLKFKNSFVIDNNCSSDDPIAYPKLESWTPENRSDCCTWNGVECDKHTGHVIDLDLTSSCVYGSIYSTSSLFNLSHLQSLSLAGNNFNNSKIPSAMGRLSGLTYLNLSNSLFHGQVPLEISRLSNLSSLDLSDNDLELKRPIFSSLVRNLRNLKHLHLISVDMSSSPVPAFLANFTSLTSLLLDDCQLHGELPNSIFHFPNLQILSLRDNPHLSGYLPAEFHSSSPLKELQLFNTSFSHKIPSSIESLHSLQSLNFGYCRFQGLVPSSLGKLTRLTILDLSGNHFEGQILSILQNLTQITHLLLGENQFTGKIPSSIGNLTKLTYLDLHANKFHGLVPTSLGKLTSLIHLDLSTNNFKGQLPCFFQNLTQLIALNLASNEFMGQISSCLGNLTQLESSKINGHAPCSITRFTNLEYLDLYDNNLGGTLDFDMFLGLKNLDTLFLSGNMLSVQTKTSNKNGTFPRFTFLGLGSCNLTYFPDFLKYQDRLLSLDLQLNQIHGQIPKWIWNITIETMVYVDLSGNSLTGFDHPLVFIPWVHLTYIDLSFNKFQGQLPFPPPSTIAYRVSNNKFSGEVPPFFSNLSSLQLLDLSNNQLSGKPPPCLKNLRSTMLVLNMSNNHFHGGIPHICANQSNLRMIDVSNNQFQGRLPKMLANCTMLEVLNLGNNRFNDVFPSWLGTLPKLRLLILRSNSLHGMILRKQNDHNPEPFSSLHVIDLSNNSFSGPLPCEYFKKWNAMKVKDSGSSSYLKMHMSFYSETISWSGDLDYSTTITSKGMFILYEKIQEALLAIDLSSNRFEGSISDSLGNLQGLHVLNLSNNVLTGSIPSLLGNITELESLDLSHNKLSGKIPPQLEQLTYLSVFVVCHNHLTGRIPQGNQFNTFGITSYEGNMGLCGKPLPIECDQDYSPPPSGAVDEQQDSESPFKFEWLTIVPGYVCGLVIGVVVEQIVATKKHYGLVKTFSHGKLKGRKGRRGLR